MKYKKKLIKITICFFAFIILCTFLSRTIMYYMTPKATHVWARSGVIKQEVKALGVLEYPSAKEIVLTECMTYPVVIDEVIVKEGDQIAAEDVLFTTKPSKQLESDVEQAKERIKAITQSIEDFEKQLPYALLNVDKNIVQKKEELAKLCYMGVSSASNGSSGEVSDDEEYLKNIHHEKVILLETELNLLMKQREDLLNGMNGNTSRQSLNHSLDEARNNLDQLEHAISSLQTVKATEAGIVSKVHIQEGQLYRGEMPAYAVYPLAKPTICVTLPSYWEPYLEKDPNCQVEFEDGKFEAYIVDVVSPAKDPQGRLTAVIEPSGEFWNKYTEPVELLGKSINVYITYTSQNYSVVIPNSCVFEKEGNPYVYVIKDRSTFWGVQSYVEEVRVTLGESNDRSCAVIDGLSQGVKLANNWDRVLSNASVIIDLTE